MKTLMFSKEDKAVFGRMRIINITSGWLGVNLVGYNLGNTYLKR